MHTFEAVSSALDDIASIMGSCRIYESIYSRDFESAKAVIGQLPPLYAHCLRFMAEAIDYFHTKAPSESHVASWNGTEGANSEIVRVAEGVTNPFETRFKPLIGEISSGNGELERRCAVASRQCKFHRTHSPHESWAKKLSHLPTGWFAFPETCSCSTTNPSSAGPNE